MADPVEKPTLLNSSAPTLSGDSPRHSTINMESEKPETEKQDVENSAVEEKDIEKVCSSCRRGMPEDEEKEIQREQGLDHPDKDIVTWDGPDDPEKPINWSNTKKWTMILTSGFMTFTVSFSSSVFSPTILYTAAQFHVSEEVMVLSICLYVVGFAFGPLVFGPMSELYGRTRPMFIGMFGFCLFQIPVAVAQNVETIFICRFFCGLFGSAPLAIVAGQYVDFCAPAQRGVATAVFAAAVFLGPALGPVIGSFITQSYLGWRWTIWISLIMSSFFSLVAFLTIPETFEPVLLKWKAEKLRPQTGNWALHAKIEEHPVHMKSIVERYLMKPMHMIVKEPILVIFTLYMSLVYGLLYLTFEAFPISFSEDRHWRLGVGSLPFLSLGLGISSACISLAIFSMTWFQKRLLARGKIYAEDRLPPMIAGSIFLPIGLFWFAWTSSPHISWVPQVISAYFIGLGIILIFMSAVAYLVDVYLMSANSAIAVNTFIRSALAAGFTMFAGPMFHNLGVAWGSSVLAFISIALVPFPLLFWKYGEKVRAWSKFSVVL